MKKCFALIAFALLMPGVAATDQPTAPATPAAANLKEGAPERSPEALLADIFNAHRPVSRSSSCEEQVYQDCLTYCWELSQTNGCDFFASQTCLCWRYPVDCPVCY